MEATEASKSGALPPAAPPPTPEAEPAVPAEGARPGKESPAGKEFSAGKQSPAGEGAGEGTGGESLAKWREKIAAFTREFPIATQYIEEIGAYFRADKQRLHREGALECALLHAMTRDEAPPPAPMMTRGGLSPAAAPVRPRSIREAGELAVQMIEKNYRR